jgi:hypothetical protein
MQNVVRFLPILISGALAKLSRVADVVSQIHWSLAELNEIMSRGGNKALTRR